MNVNLLKNMLSEFMLNSMDRLDNDRIEIMNRISFLKLSSDDYYDLLVNDIRRDSYSHIFRQLRTLIDMFL